MPATRIAVSHVHDDRMTVSFEDALRNDVNSGLSWSAIFARFPTRSPTKIRRHAERIGLVERGGGEWPVPTEDDAEKVANGAAELLEVLRREHQTGAGEPWRLPGGQPMLVSAAWR